MEDSFNNNVENEPIKKSDLKPDVRVYKAEVVNENENVYRERTTTIKEKEIIGNDRPQSSLAQIILAVCAFITISFAIFDKVLKPYFDEKKEHPLVVADSGNLEARIISFKNNGKFILLDCQVTNTSNSQNVTFFNQGKIIDNTGNSASKVFIQPDGTNSFNISDESDKEIEMPKGVPVRIRLMYDFKTKEETINYASFNTSVGKIEFKTFSAL